MIVALRKLDHGALDPARRLDSVLAALLRNPGDARTAARGEAHVRALPAELCAADQAPA
ncbi:hypothetical protein [Thiohalocapsa halophila]